MEMQEADRSIDSLKRWRVYDKFLSYNTTTEALEQLAIIAESDSPLANLAQQDLLAIASRLVWRINHLAKKNSASWRKISEYEVYWPVNISLHPSVIKGMKRDALIRKHLEDTLHLGRFCLPAYDINAKWSRTSPFTRLALRLVRHVAQARLFVKGIKTTSIPAPREINGGHGELDLSAFYRLIPPPPAGDWRLAAGDLPAWWSKDTAKQWAEVAVQAFLESYPQPEQIQELADEIGAHFSKDPEVGALTADCYTPGKRRDRILSRLKKTIHDIAPK